MPMVVMNVGENESLAYLSNRQVFPTPEKYKVSIKYWVVDVLSFCWKLETALTTIADHKKLDLHIERVISTSHI